MLLSTPSHCSSGHMLILFIFPSTPWFPCPCWRISFSQHDATTTMFPSVHSPIYVRCSFSFPLQKLLKSRLKSFILGFNFSRVPSSKWFLCPYMACGKLKIGLLMVFFPHYDQQWLSSCYSFTMARCMEFMTHSHNVNRHTQTVGICRLA